MAEFNRKNKQNIWHSPLVLVVLFCLLILFLYNIIGLIETERETAKKKELVLSNIESLRAREESLNSDINRLNTEEGIEETIRDKYQVVKEGEKMVVIVDEEKNNKAVGVDGKKHGFVEWIKGVIGIKN